MAKTVTSTRSLAEQTIRLDRSITECYEGVVQYGVTFSEILHNLGKDLENSASQIGKNANSMKSHDCNYKMANKLLDSTNGFGMKNISFSEFFKKTFSDHYLEINSKFKGAIPKDATEIIRALRDTTNLMREFDDSQKDNELAKLQVSMKTDELLKTESPSADQIKAFKTWIKLICRRREGKLDLINSFREKQGVISSKISESFENSKSTLIERQKKSYEIFQHLSTIYKKYSEDIDSYVIELLDSFENTKAKDMIKEYCDFHKIARIDLTPLPFKPVDFPSNIGVKIEHPIITMSNPLPVGIARVVREYKTSALNQIKCLEGTSLYMLETPRYAWVLSMNPLSKVKGFAPRSAIAPIGIGAAIVIDDVIVRGTRGEVPLKRGQVVAIARQEENLFLIETITRQRVRVHSTHLVVTGIFK